MSEFRLQNEKFTNEEVLENYHNVYIHCQGNWIVSAHMLILAQQSPFCHKFFQSRKNMRVADMFFPNMRHSVVLNAIRVLCGKLVHVSKSDSTRICSFFKLLEVQFEISSTEEESTASMSVEDDTEQHLEEDQTRRENKETEQIGLNAPEHVFVSPTPFHPENLTELDHLDTWTKTTTDLEKIDEIGHTLERNETGDTKYYKCKFCPVTSKAFNSAERHFINKHRNIKAELELFRSIHTRQSRLMQNFADLSSTGVNKQLIMHEATSLQGDLETCFNELEQISCHLPVHLEFKRRDFMRKLTADIQTVKNFIDKFP